MEQGLFSSSTPFTPPTTEDDRLAWLRLIRSRKVGPATFHRLIDEHGNAQTALAALPDMARSAGVKDYAACPEGVAHAELAAGRRAGARLICFGTDDYPADLADLPDAPPVLWARGDIALLARPMVAVVGARNASSLGQRMARRLAEGLADQGITVVSGLARGIDTAAHAAALAGGTVAVMAGGIDVIYPAENADLARQIGAQGVLLSEQPPGLDPQARHFPLRNRIISGMALGVIVVEAAARSGSLITARNALDQGREVLAVPGHPVDARAAGCNQLIRDGATLIRSAEDVTDALGPALAAARAARPQPPRPVPSHGLAEGGTALPRIARSIALAGARILGATGSATGPSALAEPSALASGARTGAGAPRRPPIPPGPAARPSAETAALHREILARLGPSPLAEDQLIRDLALPASTVAPELLTLELDGEVLRQAGGLLSRRV